LEDVKNVVRKNVSDGVADNGLTLKGKPYVTLGSCVFDNSYIEKLVFWNMISILILFRLQELDVVAV